jgi:hypothetical protein
MLLRSQITIICPCISRNVSNKKMAVFWVVAPCSLVEVYQRFNPEDSHLRTHRRENLKSYFQIKVVYFKENCVSYFKFFFLR